MMIMIQSHMIETELKTYSTRVEKALQRWLPAAESHPTQLHTAMRYSVLNGGKRIRPALMYATGVALSIPLLQLDGPACAVELIHAYSLVHDDLPAMDDDDLRRGKPTCHMAFDEATAILAGDAMQALAFHILAHDPGMTDNPQARLHIIDTLALAAGSRGMAGGQAIDLASVGRKLNIAELEDMHVHKTGALIRASIIMAAGSNSGIDRNVLDKLDHFARCIGLAFQIHDDILDVEGDTKTLGKQQGADIARDKPTYPSLVGMNEAKSMAQGLLKEALQSIEPLGKSADTLRAIAEYIVMRSC